MLFYPDFMHTHTQTHAFLPPQHRLNVSFCGSKWIIDDDKDHNEEAEEEEEEEEEEDDENLLFVNAFMHPRLPYVILSFLPS